MKKAIRIFFKSIFYLFLISAIIVFSGIIYLDNSISKEYKIKKGTVLEIDSPLSVTAEYNDIYLKNQCDITQIGSQYDVKLKLFGVIPFSTASVEIIDEMHVAVLGTPFGMRLYTEGVLVIDITDVQTENGNQNPAKKAGIKKGDYIISVNNKFVHTNEDLSDIVSKSNGEKMKFEIMRSGKRIHINLTAVKCKDTGEYKIGIWIRDSSAGIGTLTFYSPANNIVCGLGHGICDEDTGELLNIETGEIVSAEIISAVKGKAGTPGELKGRFTEKSLGDIMLNCSGGVYSTYKITNAQRQLTEIALKQEIKNGSAQIFCTIEGDLPDYYDCEIKVRPSAFMSKTQNFIVTITDKDLLSKTGGIVQGMSGSPILQNGKLIGAVTHVLIDDSQKGYGIFAENMLETAQGVAENNKLKDVS